MKLLGNCDKRGKTPVGSLISRGFYWPTIKALIESGYLEGNPTAIKPTQRGKNLLRAYSMGLNAARREANPQPRETID